MSAPSEAIRAGILETRERIGHDLDEIGEKLNPQHIKEEIKEGIRDATIGRVEHMARNAGQTLNNASDGLIQKIRDNPVPAVVAGVGIAWLLFGSQANRAVSGAKDAVSEAKDAVSGAANPQVDNVRSAYTDNPMALAAGVFALGAIAGILAPPTRVEGRLMGDVGERVVEKVTEAARETSQKAQSVAERVVEETKAAVRDEGLTSPGSEAAATI